MKNKVGFSFISFLLYLMFNMIVVCCMCHTATTIILPSLQSIFMHKKQLSLHIALDAFVRDVRSCQIKEWKLMAPNNIIWNDGKNDIGWGLFNNNLERIQGIYNNNSWHKRRTSILALGISNVNFVVDYKNGKVIGIECNLADQDSTKKIVSSYVAMR